MKTFAESALSFISDRPDAQDRQRAWSAFEEAGLPTTSDEVWRYAPLKDLVIDSFNVSSAPATQENSPFASQLCERAGLVVRVVDGFCVDSGSAPSGVHVEVVENAISVSGASMQSRYESDTFAVLNNALAPATTVIKIDDGIDVERPIIVLNSKSGSSSFSSTITNTCLTAGRVLDAPESAAPSIPKSTATTTAKSASRRRIAAILARVRHSGRAGPRARTPH